MNNQEILNSIKWAFNKTDRPIGWIKKWASHKHGVTQSLIELIIRDTFTNEQIRLRASANAKLHGAKFDGSKEFNLNKKLDSDFQKRMEREYE